MGIKIIVILLGIIDLALLVYAYYYYHETYRKGLDKADFLLLKIKEKMNKKEIVEKIVEKKDVSFVKENDSTTINVKQKIKFEDALKELNDEQKGYYQEILDYALSFENTNTYQYSYDIRIRVGQRKTLAIITIKNDCLVVKFKMGSLKVSDDLEPLQLKPIKVTVKNSDDVIEVKKQIEMAYSKQTGALNVSVEGDKNND